MRVFVTFPYTSAHDPMNCEYLAEVVRVETLLKNRVGVAVDLKMTLNMGPGFVRITIGTQKEMQLLIRKIKNRWKPGPRPI